MVSDWLWVMLSAGIIVQAFLQKTRSKADLTIRRWIIAFAVVIMLLNLEQIITHNSTPLIAILIVISEFVVVVLVWCEIFVARKKTRK